MNNIQITNNILTNNIYGSFFVIMWREEEKSKFDFIDPLRISMYHHLILREGKKFTFPDIMDCNQSCNGQDFHFNNLESKYDKDADYYYSGKEIREHNLTPEEFYNTYVQILENKSRAILEVHHPLYRKLCGYKVTVMKGFSIPIYGIKIIRKRFKTFDLLSGEDVLSELKLKKSLIRWYKEML